MFVFRHRIFLRYVIVSTAALLTACASFRAPDDLAAAPPVVAEASAVRMFSGRLPCADCAGVDMALALHPNGGFLLSQTYVGVAEQRKASLDSGRWALSGDGEVLVLFGGAEQPRRFLWNQGTRLQLLDLSGQLIVSTLPYDLLPVPSLPQAELMEWRLSGDFTYLADAAVLHDCRSGMRFPVVGGKDYLSLERAYLNARDAPGEKVGVAVDARVVRLPSMEGEGLVPTLQIAHFGGLDSSLRCPEGAPSLADTAWVLTDLQGHPLASPKRSEPSLVFAADGKQLRGRVDCKEFSAHWAAGGDGVRVSKLSVTPSACGEAAVPLADVLDAFERVTSYRQAGRSLDLFADGRWVLRYQIVPAKSPAP